MTTTGNNITNKHEREHKNDDGLKLGYHHASRGDKKPYISLNMGLLAFTNLFIPPTYEPLMAMKIQCCIKIRS